MQNCKCVADEHFWLAAKHQAIEASAGPNQWGKRKLNLQNQTRSIRWQVHLQLQFLFPSAPWKIIPLTSFPIIDGVKNNKTAAPPSICGGFIDGR